MKTIKIKRRLKSSLLRIKELESFKGKDVEMEIRIKDSTQVESKKISESLAGIFREYANIKLISKERKAWELAVREKHENYRR